MTRRRGPLTHVASKRRCVVAGCIAGALVLAAAVVASTGSATASPGPWSVVASPNTDAIDASDGISPAHDELVAVSCASNTMCVAVGSQTPFQAYTLAEAWDGTSWHLTPTLGDPTIFSAAFGDVSCPSTTMCLAVGSYQNGTGKFLAERWDGSAWQVVDTPGGVLYSSSGASMVSCSSPTSCIVLGSHRDPWPAPGPLATAWSWNGSVWTTIPYPEGDEVNDLDCLSSTWCLAVGTIGNEATSTMDAFVSRWDGATWTTVPAADVPGMATNRLRSVSCSSTTSCMAVGYGDASDTTMSEFWNGSVWTIAATPNPNDGFNWLRSVSCISASYCVAVGTGSDAMRTFLLEWNGNAWSFANGPASTGSPLDSYYDVSCAAGGVCAAVGAQDAYNWPRTLVAMTTGATGPPPPATTTTTTTTTTPTTPVQPAHPWPGCAVSSCLGGLGASGVHAQFSGSRACRASTSSSVIDSTAGLPSGLVGAFQVGDSSNQEAFVVGSDLRVYHNYVDGGRAVGWSSLGAPASGIVGSVRNGTNYVGNQELYVRAGDGQVYHLYATPGSGSGWRGWDPIGAPAAGISGDVYEGTNYLHNQELYVLDNNGVVYHKFSTPGQGTGWSNWDPMGAPAGVRLVGDVQIGINSLCNQELYVADASGQIWHKYSTPGVGSGWSDWDPMGGPPGGAAGSVSVGQNLANNQELFAVGRDGSIYHDIATPGAGSGWSGWTSLGAPGGTVARPAVWVDTYPTLTITVWTDAGVATNRLVGAAQWTGWSTS